jgi:hypothetical protein
VANPELSYGSPLCAGNARQGVAEPYKKRDAGWRRTNGCAFTRSKVSRNGRAARLAEITFCESGYRRGNWANKLNWQRCAPNRAFDRVRCSLSNLQRPAELDRAFDIRFSECMQRFILPLTVTIPSERRFGRSRSHYASASSISSTVSPIAVALSSSKLLHYLHETFM